MADNETTADLIAWLRMPREGENAYLTEWRNEIADRLEAANKRERAKIEADALEVGGIVEAAHRRELSKNVSKNGVDFGQLGDAAKLREALDELVANIEMRSSTFGLNVMVDTKTYLDAKTALAAPPRNCDRFASAEEAWDAYDEWVESYRAKGETEPFNEFGWLFAPATEKEGGNDGNE